MKELQIRIAKAVLRASGSFHTRIGLLKCLSQCAGKPAYTVLRGLGIGDNPRLPDYLLISMIFYGADRFLPSTLKNSLVTFI